MADEYKNQMPVDGNGNPIQVMKLHNPEDLDGSVAHDESAAIAGKMVRIVALGGDIRFLISDDPTALTTSHFLAQGQEIYQPCNVGDKVSVLGNTAHVSTAGELVIN